MMRSKLLRVLLPLAALALLSGCEATSNLLFEPAPNDPNDGYNGGLQAGVNTEMDWGPQQSMLLAEYKTLRQEHSSLEKRLQVVEAENENLKTQLNDERKLYEAEKTESAQATAMLTLAQQKANEHLSTILNLRIEKAKAEQELLLAQINLAQVAMQELAPSTTEATAMPPANR